MAAKKTKKKQNKKTKQKKSEKKFSLFGFLFKWSFVLGLWGLIIGGGMIAWYAGELPSITQKATFEPKTSVTIKAADGTVLERYGEVSGVHIGVENLPSTLIYAVLATEDRRFYEHFGLDFLGVARAMVTNLKSGRLVQGGSTITQQLAKNLFLSQERTLKRKIQEALLALWLERKLSKDEILSAYLNRVYLGAGTYGVEAAAEQYFRKSAIDLNLRESATIAGLLKAPSRYNPQANPHLSKERTDVVLSAMADAGYITKTQAKATEDISPIPSEKPSTSKGSRYYTDWVMDGLKELIGTPQEDLIVETTLDPSLQESAEKALNDVLLKYGEDRAIGQGAVLTLGTDGAVIAMVGGANYNRSQFNRAVQAKRQPGSAFKPFLYLAAIEQGWRASDTILDAPFEENESEYRPKNFEDEYAGKITLEEALTKSVNTAAVRLMKKVGYNSVRKLARRMGIFSPLGKDLSLALGTYNVSMLEICTAYAVIANKGLAVYPYAITRITDKDGNLYYQRPSKKMTRRIVERSDARAITAMMESVVKNGTGRRAKIKSMDIAGKTGTSQNSRDAWFIGFNDELVTGVWLGNDDNTPMDRVTGGTFPADIFHQTMLAAHKREGSFYKERMATSSFQSLLQSLIPTGNNSGGVYEKEERAD